MKNYILLAVAVLAGILAFVISRAQIQKDRQRLMREFNTREVLVASRDLLKGDTLKAEDIGVLPILRNRLSGTEISEQDAHHLIGRKLASDIDAKQPFKWRDVIVESQRRGGSEVAKIVREGERAVTVGVDVVSSVGNLIEPNDHVDILATFRFPAAEGESAMDTVTLTLLQNVTVLATGQHVATQTMGTDGGGGRRGYSNLTLAVTPKEAELLVFAQQKGKLTCTLRHPEDVYVSEDIQDVDFEYLQEHLKAYMEERRRRIMQEE